MDSIERIKQLENKLTLLKAFVKHSLKGFKCSECDRFIPNSYEGYNCPYPKCKKIFDKTRIKKKHPTTSSRRQFVYINNTINKYSDDQKEFSEKYCDGGDNAYDLLLSKQENMESIKIITDVIANQKKANRNARKIPIKEYMYDAFDMVLKEFPDEMKEYLINGGQNKDVSIQAIIFQMFVDVVESKLPIVVFIKGIQIKVEDLLDDNLNIFDSKRKFVNFLDYNLIIKKKSQIRIDNGNEIEDKSSHFIGKIISIKDSNNNDLSELIDSYSFSNIKMNNSELLKPGMDITVEYYSLRPSYTMGSLIHLQRLKKKITDSVNRKIS